MSRPSGREQAFTRADPLQSFQSRSCHGPTPFPFDSRQKAPGRHPNNACQAEAASVEEHHELSLSVGQR